MSDESQWKFTEEVDGHKWGFWKGDKFECCRWCGMVRRADKRNKHCRGKVKVELR